MALLSSWCPPKSGPYEESCYQKTSNRIELGISPRTWVHPAPEEGVYAVCSYAYVDAPRRSRHLKIKPSRVEFTLGFLRCGLGPGQTKYSFDSIRLGLSSKCWRISIFGWPGCNQSKLTAVTAPRELKRG